MCQCQGAKRARGRGSQACRTYLLLTLVVMMLLALAHLLLVSRVFSNHYNSLNCGCKRKIATVATRGRGKHPRCNSDPSSVTPSQRVKEFPNEQLKVSSGKVFHEACREELSIKKSIKDILHHQNPRIRKG